MIVIDTQGYLPKRDRRNRATVAVMIPLICSP